MHEDELNIARRDEVARLIKAAFIRRKERIAKKRVKLSARHASLSIFRKAADVCIDAKVSPEKFVDLAFEYCGKRNGPFSTALAALGAKAVENYKHNTKDLEETHNPKTVQIPETPVLYEQSDIELKELVFEIQQTDNLRLPRCRYKKRLG